MRHPIGRFGLFLVPVAAMTLALSFVAYASAAPPAGGPPGQGECDRGNSTATCRPDPQPSHGQDCDEHGPNEGGINEDHCGGEASATPEVTPSTSPSASPTPSASPSPSASPIPTPTPTAIPSATSSSHPSTGPSPSITISPSTETTNAPLLTLPPTDMVATPAGPVDSGGLLLIIAGLLMIATAAIGEEWHHYRRNR